MSKYKLDYKEYKNALDVVIKVENTLLANAEALKTTNENLKVNWRGSQSEENTLMMDEALDELGNYDKGYRYVQANRAIMEDYQTKITKLMATREQLGKNLHQDDPATPDISVHEEDELIINYDAVSSLTAAADSAVDYGLKMADAISAMIDEINGIAPEYFDFGAAEQALESGKKKIQRVANFRDAVEGFAREMSDFETSMSIDLAAKLHELGDAEEAQKAFEKTTQAEIDKLNGYDSELEEKIDTIINKPPEEWTTQETLYITEVLKDAEKSGNTELANKILSACIKEDSKLQTYIEAGTVVEQYDYTITANTPIIEQMLSALDPVESRELYNILYRLKDYTAVYHTVSNPTEPIEYEKADIRFEYDAQGLKAIVITCNYEETVMKRLDFSNTAITDTTVRAIMGAEGCAEIEKSWAYLTSQEEIECLKSLYKRDYASAYAKPLEQMGDTVKWQIGAYQIQLGMYKDQKTALEEMQKQINVLQDQTWYEGEGKVYANQENIIWISDILTYQNSIYQSNLTAYEKEGITVTDEYRQICKSTQKVSDMWEVLRNMNIDSPQMPKEVMAMMSNVTTRRCSLYITNLRMNEEKTGYIFDIGLINNETGEVVSDYSDIGELEEVKETIDVQETVSQIPAPPWNERVEAFSDSTLGNIAAALCILPFAGNKALVDTLIRDMSLQESLTESMEFGKGYNQAGLKAAGNTVIGMVTAPDSIAMLLGTMLEKGAINTIETMVGTMYSDLKTNVEENLIHGDARSRGEIFANIAMCIAEVVLGAYSSRIGKAFTIGDMTDEVVDEAMKASKLDEVIEGGSKTISQLLKETTCSNDELYVYLSKQVGSDVAEAFAKNGTWPSEVQIPKNSSALNLDGSMNWSRAPQGGYTLDANGNAIKETFTPKIGEVIDRYGPADGRYTSPVIDGKAFSYSERALPYVEDVSKYHQYEVTGDFTKIEEYVKNCTNNELKAKIDAAVTAYYDGDYSKLVSYKGKAAGIEGWGKGGAIQYEFSLTVEQLEGLGLLKEIK